MLNRREVLQAGAVGAAALAGIKPITQKEISRLPKGGPAVTDYKAGRWILSNGSTLGTKEVLLGRTRNAKIVRGYVDSVKNDRYFEFGDGSWELVYLIGVLCH